MEGNSISINDKIAMVVVTGAAKTREEAAIALMKCGGDVNDTVSFLCDSNHIAAIRKQKTKTTRPTAEQNGDLVSKAPPIRKSSKIDDLKYSPERVSRGPEIESIASSEKKFEGKNETPRPVLHLEATSQPNSSLPSHDRRGSATVYRQGFRPRAPQRNVQPGAVRVGDILDADDSLVGEIDTMSHPRDELVSAEVVDPEEDNRILEAKVEERLAKERQEREREIAEAQLVTGFWCSTRTKVVGSIGVFLAVVGVVLGIVLPRALESPEPTAAPTAAATSALPGLVELLSSVSFDDGEALQPSSTPQNNGLIWLSGNVHLDTYSDEQKIQRYALATFYYSTRGDSWESNRDWLSDLHECTWYSNSVESFCVDDKVVELTLWDNNIGGTIPVEISLLSSSLRLIGIGAVWGSLLSGSLTGAIPSELGLLTQLTSLTLFYHNSLAASIPSELKSLTKLTRVNLERNSLTGAIPSELAVLTQLNSMNLGYNSLAGTIRSYLAIVDQTNFAVSCGQCFDRRIHLP